MNDHSRLTWFACCGERTAWAQDVWPDEIERHAAELREAGLLIGRYATRQEALAIATAVLMMRTTGKPWPMPKATLL